MRETLHSLVVGTGAIGQRHLRHLADLAPGGRYSFLRRDNAPRGIDALYDPIIRLDLDAALQDRPDLAIVASPSACHIEVLPQLIAANIPLYVEKPIVISAADVVVIEAALAAADPGVPRLAGFNFRYLPSLERLRALIAGGGLGRIVRAHLSAGQWLPDWRPGKDYRTVYSARLELGGGVLFDLIHELDLARWWFGTPQKVQAMTGALSSLGLEVEDSCTVMMRFEGGPLVTVGLDYVARQRLRRYEIIGDAGTAIWDLATRRLCIERSGGITEEICGPEGFDVAATYPAALTELLAAVHARKSGAALPASLATRQDLASGLASSALAIDIRKAASP